MEAEEAKGTSHCRRERRGKFPVVSTQKWKRAPQGGSEATAPTVGHHVIPTEVAIIKSYNTACHITSVGLDVEKYTAGENVKWCSCCRKHSDSSSKS